jgi:hypothetical protein
MNNVDYDPINARPFGQTEDEIYADAAKEDFANVEARVAATPASPSFEQIIAYEDGTLDHDEMVALFQQLTDTGMAWSLQGHYGRTAARLIAAGECRPAGNVIPFPGRAS